jgi:tetratricopeptide (TPR) repeat protein
LFKAPLPVPWPAAEHGQHLFVELRELGGSGEGAVRQPPKASIRPAAARAERYRIMSQTKAGWNGTQRGQRLPPFDACAGPGFEHDFCMPQLRNLERPWLISAMLALAVLAAYLPAVYLGFVDFDDNFYVTENRHVQQGLTWASIGWAFAHFHAANWHPAAWISHMADVQLYGLNPLGHHVTNVLLHAANTVLVFLWLRSMTGATWKSALVAALFGLHPLRVESVAWVAERKDVLSAFFGILSLWAYARYVAGRRRWFSYCAALVLFACGLLSKPMLVTWPFVMLLLDYWPLGRFMAPPEKRQSMLAVLKPALLDKIPFLALSAGSSLATFLAQRAGGAVSAFEGQAGVSLASRLGNVPVSYVRYLFKSIWPADLAVIYPFVRAWPEEQILGASVLVIVLTALMVWCGRRRPYLAVGWLWFLGTLVPVIGLVQVGTQSMADRYTYIPGIGLLVIVAWGCGDLVERWGNKTLAPALAPIGLALLCAFLTGRQLRYWQTTESLFRHTLAVTKDNYVAQTILGSCYATAGEWEPAKARFRAALRISPNVPNAWNNLGCVLVSQKRYAEAIEAFDKALSYRPSVDAYSNLGNAQFGLGKTNEAIASYRAAVKLDPGVAGAQYNLGYALLLTGQLPEAVERFRAALSLKPDYTDARINLANALGRAGNSREAEAEFQRVLAAQPDLVTALCAYGAVLVREQRWDEALAQYSKAARAAPDNHQAALQVGIIQAAQGKWDSAIATLTKVLEALPTEPNARYYLASSLNSAHRYREAAAEYRLALKFAPEFPEALNNLAWLLATNPDPQVRNGKEAVELAERACRVTGSNQPVFIGTLAAAYAEVGRFNEAIATAATAKALAVAAGEKDVAARNEELLELYRAGKPCRDGR